MPSTKTRKQRSQRFDKRVFLDIPYKKTYASNELAITSALRAFGLEPVIARDNKTTLLILEDVANLIDSAKYGVVDISGLNFNVGFEAGFMRALKRNFILLKNGKTAVPADLQGFKYCKYRDRDTLVQELMAWLKQNVPEARRIPEHKALMKLLTSISKKAGISQAQALGVVRAMASSLAESNDQVSF